MKYENKVSRFKRVRDYLASKHRENVRALGVQIEMNISSSEEYREYQSLLRATYKRGDDPSIEGWYPSERTLALLERLNEIPEIRKLSIPSFSIPGLIEFTKKYVDAQNTTIKDNPIDTMAN